MSHGHTRRPEGRANLYSVPTSFVAVGTETTGPTLTYSLGT